MQQKLFVTVFCLAVCLAFFADQSEARYLPTRSNGDRLDKLRELLKDLLENEIEKQEYQQQDAVAFRAAQPDRKLFYKREISAPH